MSRAPLVPPIKCQGIKTKLIGDIRRIVEGRSFDRWIEPFCGSCVVALNLQPSRALLADTNRHIVTLYKNIQQKRVLPSDVKEYLRAEGENLSKRGEEYFYEVRERFNANPSSLDFLFLNRSCFNGVMRFNRSGKFNVPFCRKPKRFSASYITKIANQVAAVAKVVSDRDWEFRASGFEETLGMANPGDLVYADPPYAGRHTDYFNTWTEENDNTLVRQLSQLAGSFVLSTWHSNEFRSNPALDRWGSERFQVVTREHFYHVGSSEELRHPMIEALITNFPLADDGRKVARAEQMMLDIVTIPSLAV